VRKRDNVPLRCVLGNRSPLAHAVVTNEQLARSPELDFVVWLAAPAFSVSRSLVCLFTFEVAITLSFADMLPFFVMEERAMS
jgi:hypothetical protein